MKADSIQIQFTVEDYEAQAERWNDKAIRAEEEAERCRRKVEEYTNLAVRARENGGTLLMTANLKP